MMGKVVKSGKSFKGCVAYCMAKDLAEVLHADGVRYDEVKKAVADFNMQRKMNPNLGQAVGHIALAFSPQDKSFLDNDKMTIIALQYLERMKIANTQVLIVKHNDTLHPHLHIVYNRVNNHGKTISDSMLRQKNVSVTKALTLEHGLYYSQGKEQVKRQSLRGVDKVKYEIYDAIKAASRMAASMDDFERLLKAQNIDVLYKYQSGTENIQGISFTKGEHKFKGSEIDRSFSYGKLSQMISQRIAVEQSKANEPSLAEQIRAAMREKENSHVTETALPHLPVHSARLLETLLSQPFTGGQDDMDDALKYKKKRKQEQSKGVSR